MTTICNYNHTSHPICNLPIDFKKSKEKLMVKRFLKVFDSHSFNCKKPIKRFIIKEFSLNGYGIADLVCIDHLKLKKCESKQVITFEFKLSNWKRALSQAIRYKYYSNLTIVVLPETKRHVFDKNLTAFSDFNIGLWTFDEKNKNINALYTPRYSKPIIKNLQKKLFDSISLKLS